MDGEVLRLKENAIIDYLFLESGDIDMNRLAELDLTTEDPSQFGQLISSQQARIEELEAALSEKLRGAVFHIQPDDLTA
jgi:hypothetical protein